jgi:transcriptional regulator with XRE-family HTH domain
MESHNDSPTDIANRSGVSRDALYKVIYGKTKSPSLELVVRVANAYDETVEEFMGLTPVKIKDSLYQHIEKLTEKERQLLEASIAAILAGRDTSE